MFRTKSVNAFSTFTSRQSPSSLASVRRSINTGSRWPPPSPHLPTSFASPYRSPPIASVTVNFVWGESLKFFSIPADDVFRKSLKLLISYMVRSKECLLLRQEHDFASLLLARNRQLRLLHRGCGQKKMLKLPVSANATDTINRNRMIFQPHVLPL